MNSSLIETRTPTPWRSISPKDFDEVNSSNYDMKEEDMMANKEPIFPRPCENNLGPLNLLGKRHKLPKETMDLLNFSRDVSIVTIEEHLEKFNTYCEVNGIKHEDVAICIFFKTFTDVALHWYNSLPNGSITSWDDLSYEFLIRFKSRVHDRKLINELAHIKKNYKEYVSQIIYHFSKLFQIIPKNMQPINLVKKYFFINALDLVLGYMVIACEPITYEDAVNEAIRNEEYMITIGKIKRLRPFESKKNNAKSSKKEDKNETSQHKKLTMNYLEN